MPIYSNYTNPNSELYYANEVEDAPPPPSDGNDANQNTSTTQYGNAVQIQLSPEAQAAVQTSPNTSQSPILLSVDTTALTPTGTVVIAGHVPVRDYMDGLNLYAEAEVTIRQLMEEDILSEANWARDPVSVPTFDDTKLQDKVFTSEKSALKAAFEAINNNSLSKKREIGYFITKETDGSYKVSKAFIGSPDTLKISFNSNDIPNNAIGFIHSHPKDSVTDVNGYYRDIIEANKYPSKGTPEYGSGDIEAWNFFERLLNNNQFKMWVVGPDNQVREYNDQSELPSDYLNGNIDATQLPPAPNPVDFQNVP